MVASGTGPMLITGAGGEVGSAGAAPVHMLLAATAPRGGLRVYFI